MNAKHTPGPLKAETLLWDKEFAYAVFSADQMFRTAMLYPDGTDNQGTAQANATLYAAAPDLLEALKELLEHVEWRRRVDKEITGDTDVTHRVRAAIAKAEPTP